MADTYLSASYRDREQVKTLGARWDPVRKRWYVPEGRDLAPFGPWLGGGSAAPVVTLAGPPAGATGSGLSLAGAAPVQVAVQGKGIALSQLLAGVAAAVAQTWPAGVWTLVEVLKADLRRGLVYLELAERGAGGETLAQARALIWADTARQIVPAFERATGAVLGPGIKLLLRARPQLHPLYGLSLVVDAIDPDYTLGDLEARKREIRERLQREGLFDANRRLAPPWDFNAVLVLAPEGAAGLGDFRAEAQRLQACGLCRFVYAHSRFQGEGAAAELCAALTRALQDWTASGVPPPDALVILRGGGAVNDLAWLNDHALARWLCTCPVPVFTGIGHERDSTLLDEVAQQCFDTPSKVIAGIEQLIGQRAAQAQALFAQIGAAAVHSVQTAERALAAADGALRTQAQRHLADAREHSAQWLAGIRVDALRAVMDASQQARELDVAVRQQGQAGLALAARRVPALLAEVQSQAVLALRAAGAGADAHRAAVLDHAAWDVRQAGAAAGDALQQLGQQAQRVLATAATGAEALLREITGQGADKTLGRGFAIVRDAAGRTVTSAGAVAAGAALEITLRDGRLTAQAGATPAHPHPNPNLHPHPHSRTEDQR